MPRAGIIRAEGQVDGSVQSTDRLVIQRLNVNSGQYEPALATAAAIVTGGGGGGGSISITGDSGGALSGSAFTFTGGSTGLTFSGATATETLTGTLAVSHGGTGVTSKTAYAVICGGTTSTAPLQNVSGLGTNGQVLTSNGAGALPTWESSSSGGFTPTAITFADGSGNLTTDVSNLYFSAGILSAGGYSGGAIYTTAFRSITTVQVGEDSSAGILSIFPSAATSGKLEILAAANAGDTTTVITNASQAGARTYTIPDAGGAADFVMTAGTQTVAGAKTFTSDITGTTANVIIGTAGKGLQIKEGSNARMGTATLSSGTVTVSNTSVTANTRIFVSRSAKGASSVLGVLEGGTITPSTSFVINSYDPTDASVETNDISVIDWILVEPAA